MHPNIQTPAVWLKTAAQLLVASSIWPAIYTPTNPERKEQHMFVFRNHYQTLSTKLKKDVLQLIAEGILCSWVRGGGLDNIITLAFNLLWIYYAYSSAGHVTFCMR